MSKEKLAQTTDSDDSGPTFGPAKPGSGVHVMWGAIADHYDLAGSTVGKALKALSGALAIPDDDSLGMIVNGKQVGSDTELKEGDVLEFTRRLGEKGDEGPMVREIFLLIATAFMMGATFGYAVGLILPLFLGTR